MHIAMALSVDTKFYSICSSSLFSPPSPPSPLSISPFPLLLSTSSPQFLSSTNVSLLTIHQRINNSLIVHPPPSTTPCNIPTSSSLRKVFHSHRSPAARRSISTVHCTWLSITQWPASSQRSIVSSMQRPLARAAEMMRWP